VTAREISIDIMVPSCACCSAKLEQEVASASGLSKGAVRFVVPLRAQLRYDPKVTKVGRLLNALRERGYEVPLERVEFKIPMRPAFQPAVWKARVEGLSEKLEGVIFASVNFASSRIVVDFLPSLVSPGEIRDGVVGCGISYPEPRRKEEGEDENTKNHRDSLDAECVRRGNLYALHSLGSGLSRACDDEGVGGVAAGVQGDQLGLVLPRTG